MKKQFVAIIFALFLCNGVQAQGLLQNKDVFTRQDSLRGSITKERAWWDLKSYHLDVKVNHVD